MGDEKQDGEKMDSSELEKQLNIMCMYDEFDDCRHLVDDMFDYARQNSVKSFHVEVALELAHGDYLEQQRKLRDGPGYDDRLREVKVDVLSAARNYLSDMVHGRRTR